MDNRKGNEYDSRGNVQIMQTRSVLHDHNVKYVKFYGDAGSASITDSMSLDILNPDKLKKLIGEGVWNTKVKQSRP